MSTAHWRFYLNSFIFISFVGIDDIASFEMIKSGNVDDVDKVNNDDNTVVRYCDYIVYIAISTTSTM